MKYINWDNVKSKKLKEERGVSFEDVVFCIEKHHVLDDYEHPNNERYNHQRIMVINIDNYAYIVPYVQNESEIFLKTIIPSRKATKKYLEGVDKNEIR